MTPRSIAGCLSLILLLSIACSKERPTPPARTVRPDLLVQSIYPTPGEPVPGQDIRVHVVVQNLGPGTAPPSEALLSLDRLVLRPSLPTRALAAGALDTLACDIGPQQEGIYTLGACVDDSSLIQESSETNNCADSPLIVQFPSSPPDLVVEQILFDPSYPTPNEQVTAHILVANRGRGTSPASITSLTLNGAVICNAVETPTLPPDSSATVFCSLGSLEVMDYTIAACANRDSTVREEDKGNNCLSRILVVRSPNSSADLRIEQVHIVPEHPGTKQPITVLIEVKNIGTATAPATQGRVRVDGRTICESIDTPTIGVGGTATLTCDSPPLTAGDHQIVCCADVKDAVPELDETNNCLTVGLTVNLDPPAIPIPPVPDVLDFHSSDPVAQRAQDRANQEVRLAGGSVMTDVGELIPLKDAFWIQEGDSCWIWLYSYGSCTNTAKPCRSQEGFAWNILHQGQCGPGDPDTGRVAVTGTTSADGLVGRMLRLNKGTGAPEAAWTWELTGETSGRWVFYPGDVVQGTQNVELTWRALSSDMSELSWSPIPTPPDSSVVRWQLRMSSDGRTGFISLFESGDQGRPLDEITWTPQGGNWKVRAVDGSWTTETW